LLKKFLLIVAISILLHKSRYSIKLAGAGAEAGAGTERNIFGFTTLLSAETFLIR
jgi:hypothetical protein